MRLFDPQGTKPEAEIQKEILKRACKLGWVADKYENKSRRGGPDLLFYRGFERSRGCVFVRAWMEVKRFGEEPTEQQLKRHLELRAQGGFKVAWFDNVEDAVDYLGSLVPCLP